MNAAAFAPGVSAASQALVYRELAALLHAGIDIGTALEQASGACPPQLRMALGNLAWSARNGEPISGAMRGLRGIFHPIVPAIVGAGERTGHLDQSFSLLASFYEYEAEIVRTLRSAMVYPTIVTVTAILAVGVLSYINFMPSTWAVRLLWGLAGVAVLWLAMRLRAFQWLVRYVAMLLPFFGAVMQQLAVARFCQAFGMLTRAGVPYLEGLEATMPAIQHPVVDRAATHIYYGVRNGNPVEQSIRNEPAFPPVVRNLVGAGEAAGALDEMLLRAADYLRQDAQYKIANAAKLAGPTMTIIMGAIVLLILISFWSSYWDKLMGILEE